MRGHHYLGLLLAALLLSGTTIRGQDPPQEGEEEGEEPQDQPQAPPEDQPEPSPEPQQEQARQANESQTASFGGGGGGGGGGGNTRAACDCVTVRNQLDRKTFTVETCSRCSPRLTRVSVPKKIDIGGCKLTITMESTTCDRRNVDTETFSGRPCRNGDDRDNIPPQDSWNIPKPPNSGCCTTTFSYSYSSQPNTVPTKINKDILFVKADQRCVRCRVPENDKTRCRTQQQCSCGNGRIESECGEECECDRRSGECFIMENGRRKKANDCCYPPGHERQCKLVANDRPCLGNQREQSKTEKCTREICPPDFQQRTSGGGGGGGPCRCEKRDVDCCVRRRQVCKAGSCVPGQCQSFSLGRC